MFTDNTAPATGANRLKPADRAEAELSCLALKLRSDLCLENRYIKGLCDEICDAHLAKFRHVKLAGI